MPFRTKTMLIIGAALLALGLVLYALLTGWIIPSAPPLVAGLTGLAGGLLILLVLVFALLLSDRHQLNQIRRLIDQVMRLGQQGDLSARLRITGTDELGRLASSINTMLDSLKEARQRQVESETRYQTLVRQAREGVAIIDPQTGEILECNAAFQAILCITPEQLRGLNLNNIYDHDSRLVEEAEKIRATGQPFYFEGVYRRPDGRQVDFEVHADLIQYQERSALYATLVDTGERRRLQQDTARLTNAVELEIANRRQAEAGLEVRERYLAALVEIQQVLLTSPDEPFGEPVILTILGSASGSDRVYLLENQENPSGKLSGRLRGGWEQGSPDRKSGFSELREMVYEDFQTWQKALEAGEVVIGDTVNYPAPERAFLEERGVITTLLFPLKVDQHFAGIIGFEMIHAPRTWEAAEIALLRSAALTISASQERYRAIEASRYSAEELMKDIVERKSIEQALRESEEWIRSLYHITSSHHLSFTEKLQALLVMGSQEYQLPVGILAKITDGRYEVIASNGIEAGQFTNQSLPLSETFWAETIQAGGPLSIEQASLTEWASHAAYLRHGIESYLGTPVIVAGEMYGILAFSAQAPRSKPYSSADHEFLRLMAQWIGGEIELEQSSLQLQKFAAEIADKNQALSEARDEAIEASQQKSTFLATISHEIRTPMNAIIGMADVLLGTPLNADQREYAEVLKDSAQVLLTLMNDILDFSKMEAGKLNLESMDFDMMGTVERSAELFVPKIGEKGLAFMTYIDPAIPPTVKGDPNRLSQILFNLIGNAVKFTDRGEITVKAELIGAGEDFLRIRFSINDTGIGLSKSAQNALFKPFSQAEASTARKYGGTGLGLAISKRLVEMMGGEIGVDSQEGQGSTFWFTAQFTRPAGTVETKRDLVHFNGERILIVDDSPAHGEILRKYLETWGLRAGTCIHGSEALQELQEAQEKDTYQLALIDLSMPVMDGYLLARQIKNLPLLKDLILVGMTAYDLPGQGEQAIASGFAGYITKPMQYKHLNRKLAQLIGQNVACPAMTDEEYSLPQGVEERHGIPPLLIAEDNLANQKILSIQVQRLGYPCTFVDNGRKVLELLLQTNQRFSVLFLDCQMPEMDGFSVVRILRKAELATGQHLPVVAMTANALDGDREACLASGMDDYLSKPVSIEDLKRVLSQWISEGIPTVPGADKDRSVSALPILDINVIQGLRALQVEGEDFLGGIIDMYMHEADKLVEQIRIAISRGDAHSLRQAAHTLKGSSAGLGAARLSETCLEIETLAREGQMDDCPVLFTRLEQDYGLTLKMLSQERPGTGIEVSLQEKA